MMDERRHVTVAVYALRRGACRVVFTRHFSAFDQIIEHNKADCISARLLNSPNDIEPRQENTNLQRK